MAPIAYGNHGTAGEGPADDQRAADDERPRFHHCRAGISGGAAGGAAADLDRPSPGLDQRAEEVVIRVLGKELLDLDPVSVDLGRRVRSIRTRTTARRLLARVSAGPETNSPARAQISTRFW